jgi:predicted nucleotidyltransferase
MKTFAELLVELSRSGVKYILVGGLAVDLCGYSRVTHDVDIIIEHSIPNINLLINLLLQFGEGSVRELTIQDFDLTEGCIRIVEEFPLDVFTIMQGNTYQDLEQYINIYELEGVEIPYLNAEGLIALKKHSMRSKDQVDIDVLAQILSENH